MKIQKNVQSHKRRAEGIFVLSFETIRKYISKSSQSEKANRRWHERDRTCNADYIAQKHTKQYGWSNKIQTVFI